MASGAELSPRITALVEGRCRDDSACGLGNGVSHSFTSTDHGYAGKPPRNLPIIRQCVSSARLPAMAVLEHDTHTGKKTIGEGDVEFLPVLRSGSCSEIGPKRSMEDEFICINDLRGYAGEASGIPSPAAFYGVFDGHGGVDVASFTKKNLLGFILRDTHFNHGVKKAVRCAFFEADKAIADTTSLDSSSGTTVLTALILNRRMYVANAGDSRAVLGKRGRAVELSNDHKPNCKSERVRIEKLGGMVYDGYLEGQLSVARALGDWHLKGPKGSKCPLIPEPEVQEVVLTDEDEFLIMGCDGLWDVMSSQCAVTIVRRELMTHNDPDRSSKELVKEALRRNTCDNLTVVVICFSPHPPPRLEIPRPHRRRSISAEGLDLLKGVLNNSTSNDL